MRIQVHYQGLESTPWMDQFITNRVSKLARYLGDAASVHVNVRYDKNMYVTSLAIHNTLHDYAYTGDGVNLFESFSGAMAKAVRVLGEHKRKIKDRINKRFSSFKKDTSVFQEPGKEL